MYTKLNTSILYLIYDLFTRVYIHYFVDMLATMFAFKDSLKYF